MNEGLHRALAEAVAFRCGEIEAPAKKFIPVLRAIRAVADRDVTLETDEQRDGIESCIRDVLHLLGVQSLLPANDFSRNFWTSDTAAPLVMAQSIIYEADYMTVPEAAALIMPKSKPESARNELANKVMRGRLSAYLHPEQTQRIGQQHVIWYVRKSQVMKLLAEREVNHV